MQKIKNSVGVILILFLLLSSCAAGMRISQIKEDPRRFHDKQVTVGGEVTETIEIPILGIGLYKLSDGSGDIWVKPAGNTPLKGDRVMVTGVVKVGFTISGKSFGVILLEREEGEPE